MTRFVVDSGVVLALVAEEAVVPHVHLAPAPALLRSQLLSALHEAAERGDVTREDGRRLMVRANERKIRLLGDSAVRRRAWDVAARIGWASTYTAELHRPDPASGGRIRHHG